MCAACVCLAAATKCGNAYAVLLCSRDFRLKFAFAAMRLLVQASAAAGSLSVLGDGVGREGGLQREWN